MPKRCAGTTDLVTPSKLNAKTFTSPEVVIVFSVSAYGDEVGAAGAVSPPLVLLPEPAAGSVVTGAAGVVVVGGATTGTV